MCCGFKNITNTIASIMHMTEKLVSCLAVASVITCFVITTICMIALGIGIGYNYCVGELQAGHTYKSFAAVRGRNVYFTTPITGLREGDPEIELPTIKDYIPPSTEETSASSLISITETVVQNSTKSLKQFWRDLIATTEVPSPPPESLDSALSGLDKMAPGLGTVDRETFEKK